MRICSMTMAGPGTDDALDMALTSVAQLVDHNVIHYPGVTTDFSGQRNSLLATAAATGFDWAIMLDTDERMHTNFPGIVRAYLNDSQHDVLMVRSVELGYEKERIFRLPVRGHYKGPTHECFVLDEGATRGTLPGMTFTEERKTPEQYRIKAERDLEILVPYCTEHPDDPRWWYYLGDTYAGLGRPEDAKAAFGQCYRLDGWDEESAWSAYRTAVLFAEGGDHTKAIFWCCLGMQRHPGIAELPWLAGWCCYQLGRYQHAIYWSEMAVALNDGPIEPDRINFRYEPALHEGPWDVMRWSYKALGNHTGEVYAESGFSLEVEEKSRPHDGS